MMGGFLVEAAPRGRLQWTRERLCSRHAKALCAPKSRKIAPNRGAERAPCPRRRCTTRIVCAAEDRRAKTADEVSWGPPHWASFGVPRRRPLSTSPAQGLALPAGPPPPSCPTELPHRAAPPRLTRAGRRSGAPLVAGA